MGNMSKDKKKLAEKFDVILRRNGKFNLETVGIRLREMFEKVVEDRNISKYILIYKSLCQQF